jgi:hypothetical protein
LLRTICTCTHAQRSIFASGTGITLILIVSLRIEFVCGLGVPWRAFLAYSVFTCISIYIFNCFVGEIRESKSPVKEGGWARVVLFLVVA